jgi:hypothetical protein
MILAPSKKQGLTSKRFALSFGDMNLPTKALLALLSLCISAAAQAELSWEKTELELNPPPGADSTVATFKYENKGDKKIHINAVRTSCGCTTAALKKNDVEPGEKGEIVATLKTGDRVGLQTKTVTVETDDPKTPQTILTLKANVVQLLELQPAFLTWQADEKPTAKTITAKAGKGVTIKNLEVTPSAPDFTAKVEPGSAAGEFKIVVSPKDTAHPSTANLSIKPDSSVASAKVFNASVRVMPPASAGAVTPMAPEKTNATMLKPAGSPATNAH